MKRLNQGALLFLVIPMCFLSESIAQGASPEKLKTKNNDLRGEKKIFSVANPSDLSQNLALLESGESQFLFETEKDKRLKVSGDFAKEADGAFVKGFIDLKYATPEAKFSECPHYITLFFRGETEKVCSRDEKRVAKVEQLIKAVKGKLKGR